MDFSKLHGEIKTSIVAAGFIYIPADKWFNIEFGIFPQALTNNSFTVKFSGNIPNPHIANSDLVRMTIEFTLNSMNDKYLTKINAATTAVKNLYGALSAEFMFFDQPHGYTINYLENYAIITFNDILLNGN